MRHGVSYVKKVKGYHDIAGDGGSRVLEQVAEQRARITDGLAGVRHLVAVGSGKGGVGKSTLTLHLAGALRARGLRIAILDADFNGPSQARMAGVQGGPFVPPPSPKGSGAARSKVALPRTTNGIGVFSMGSLIPESQALDFESAAHGESHTWRATREFALLGEILGSFEWGTLDLLMFDLPPGAERTVQYADFLGPFDGAQGRPFDEAQGRPFDGAQGRPFDGAQGRPFDEAQGRPFDGAQGRPRTSFLLVTIPSEVSRGVVARSVAALSKGPHRVLGYVENMSGYYCRDCNAVKPLFASSDSPGLGIPCLGTVPFDPELARQCDRGLPLESLPETPVGRALDHVAQQLLDRLP